MSDNNNKVYVDPTYMPSNVKLNKKLTPFIVGIIFFVAYIIFTIAMVSANINYFSTYEGSMNVFRVISYMLSGLAGFYIVFAWLLSIIMVALFTVAVSSESMVISTISKILNIISILSFILPLVILFIII